MTCRACALSSAVSLYTVCRTSMCSHIQLIRSCTHPRLCPRALAYYSLCSKRQKNKHMSLLLATQHKVTSLDTLHAACKLAAVPCQSLPSTCVTSGQDSPLLYDSALITPVGVQERLEVDLLKALKLNLNQKVNM
jgi:hypothetical protein